MDVIQFDLTVVAGLDAKTFEQWKLSLPTIAANRPELLHKPWTIFYDYEQLTQNDIGQFTSSVGLDASPNIRYVAWPESATVAYPSQRGKMLAGFVHVPARHIDTQWWMKIDTDVVAAISNNWFHSEWFDDGKVLVASPWGYTKVKGDNRTALEWVNSLEEFGDNIPNTSRLNLADCVRGDKKIIRHRFWSPVSYYDIEFTRTVSRLCDVVCGCDLLPVPSQDTVHWYVAERLGAKYRTIKMQNLGWMFCNGTKRLQEMSHAVMEGSIR